MVEIRKTLEKPRDSLSPSAVSETSRDGPQKKMENVPERDISQQVLPLFNLDKDISNGRYCQFTNLASITERTAVNPVANIFDGAHPDDVNKKVRKDLNKIIIPSKEAGVLIAPNFFLEARSSYARPMVAGRQLMLNGAHGAHAMHALQNYGIGEEPFYDGNAYAFSAILFDITLQLYAHHMTAPTKFGDRPGYHTTLLKRYGLVSKKTYSKAIGAFKNLMERARDDRDLFIGIANERSRCQNTKHKVLKKKARRGGQFQHSRRRAAGRGVKSSQLL